MPKSPSRTSKKKKYNARFPPARIKKIMQTDEDVGKVAAAVPVIISRALELFIESLITETSRTTVSKNAKTLSTSHIKQTIENNKQFDFLRDLVANVPDHQTEDNGDATLHDGEPAIKKGRGRPRKNKDTPGGKKQRGESSKAASDSSEEDYDEEEDEDTETDEEGTAAASSAPMASLPPHMGYSNPNDRLLPSSMPSSSTSGSNVYSKNPENFNPSHSPAFINPAMTSIQKQQQQLQPHHQFQQQQQQQQQNRPSENLPVYAGQAFPPYMARPPQNMGNYPLPPQFPNSYTPLPSSQHQNPHHQNRHPLHSQLPQNQQPGSMQYPPNMPLSQDQGIPQSPNHQLQHQHFVQQQQPQPMNLSFSSRAMATTAGDDDDYDT